jgi:hypothetical protein
MSDRPARVRLMLESGSFLGGLQIVSAQVRGLGQSMQSALSNAAGAGLDKFKSSLSGIASRGKQIGGMLLGIGGGVGVAAAAKEAIEIQGTYRNLANQINRLRDTGKDWHDVQLMIEHAAESSGMAEEKLADAFREVYSATGDLRYSEEAVKAIGTAARASGEDAVGLAMPIQLAARKFGVGADQVEEAMARIIEKIGVGGADLSTLNMRFAVMAGEAAAAGMKGVEGFSGLLGIMLKLDSSIGEKAAPGLKALFQYLKDNTSQLRAISKQSGIKFKIDTTAFEKLRELIGKAKGRKTAEMVFTADSRVVYDTLVEPFETAFKAARSKGASVKEATRVGYQAYDAAMAKMTESTAKFSKLQEQAADRLANDPAAVLEKSVNEFKRAFTKPEMMAGLERMAKALPPVVEGLGRLIGWLSKNPWEGATALVAGLIVKDVASAGIGMAIKAALLALMPPPVPVPPVTPAAGGAAAAAGGAAAKGAATGAAGSIPMLGAAAIVAAGLATSGDEGSVEERRAKIKERQKRALSGAKDRYSESYRRAMAAIEKARAEQAVPEIVRTTGPRAFPLPVTTGSGGTELQRQALKALNPEEVRAEGKAAARAHRDLATAAERAAQALARIRTPPGQPPTGAPRGGPNGLPPPAPRTPGYAPR